MGGSAGRGAGIGRDGNPDSPTTQLLTMAIESGIIVYRSTLAMKDHGGSILLMLPNGTVQKGLTPERAAAWMSGWQAAIHHSSYGGRTAKTRQSMTNRQGPDPRRTKDPVSSTQASRF